MIATRRQWCLAFVAVIIAGSGGRAAAADATWDGSWSGILGHRYPWPITITIAGGKVVSFVEKGVSIAVRYSKVTPNRVRFGDNDHYIVSIDRSGASTAAATVQGRHGYGKAMLTRG